MAACAFIGQDTRHQAAIVVVERRLGSLPKKVQACICLSIHASVVVAKYLAAVWCFAAWCEHRGVTLDCVEPVALSSTTTPKVRALYFRLHEKSGRYNVVPAYHTTHQYVDVYLAVASIAEDCRRHLFRSTALGPGGALLKEGLM